MRGRGFDTPLVLGANTIDVATDEAFNSALLLDRSGQLAGTYDKVWLLAFGEYVPGIKVFPFLKYFLPAGSGAYTPGPGPGILELKQPGGQIWRLGPVICYEGLAARISCTMWARSILTCW